MAQARTEAEWRELAGRLKAIADDPEEEKSRRIRALAILETIPREFRSRQRFTEDFDMYDPREGSQ